MDPSRANWQVGQTPPGDYCSGPGRGRWRPLLGGSNGSGKEKTAVQCLPWVNLGGLAGFGPQEKEVVISSKRGSPGRGTTLERTIMLSHCTGPISTWYLLLYS